MKVKGAACGNRHMLVQGFAHCSLTTTYGLQDWLHQSQCHAASGQEGPDKARGRQVGLDAHRASSSGGVAGRDCWALSEPLRCAPLSLFLKIARSCRISEPCRESHRQGGTGLLNRV